MAIQLFTFGGLHAVDDNGELDWLLGQHSRAALLIYLAVERRVSRESLTAIFWPESDAENARHALRQSLYHLRKAVGSDWLASHAHELVVTGDVRVDTHAFTKALEGGDLASAVELYRGPFLDGVHLVDLQSWENWVDSRRAQLARSFRKACRDLIDSRLAAQDSVGAIKAAEIWATRDPLDDEAQHRLIETLAAAGERAEAIRQYETYARLCEAEGSEPLDETVVLAKRLQSEAAPLPRLGGTATHSVKQPRSDDTSVATATATRGLRRSWWGALLIVAAVASVWGARRVQSRPVTSANANVIAVLPFSVRGDASVAYLHEGIVSLLGAALDGAGSIRRADTRATFAALAAAGADAPDQHAERVASGLGAGKYVVGDIVEAGGQLQIEAGVYHIDVACGRAARSKASSACRAGQAETKAVVGGPADSVFELVDRLAARLLGGLGDTAADRLRRTAALTTSLPALKAYLEGEELMRAAQFERAADAYLSAIALDSTFAVAHYRLALAREWAPLPGEDSAANAAARHGSRLSARDRQLLEAFSAWRSGNAQQAEHAYREILARYPDDIDAWFQLGEVLFHHGPLLGRPLGESEEAWRRVLSYEPRNAFAITHAARIALLDRRTATLDSLLSPFSAQELQADRRLTEIVLLRAVARGDTAAAHALAKEVRRWESAAVWRVAVFLTAFTPDPSMMRGVLQDLLDGYPRSGLRADLLWFGSLLDLAAGRLAASRADRVDAVAVEAAVPREARRWGFDDATAWYAATLPIPFADSTVMRLRHEASVARFAATVRPAFESQLRIGSPIQMEPLRQYTLGILSLRVHDTVAAKEASRKLEQLASTSGATTLVRDLDRAFRARFAWQRGRAHDALQLLEAMESRDTQGDVAAIPFVSRASERFLRGEVLASLGRNAEALRWFGSLHSGSVTEIPFLVPSHLRQAEIHERLGHRNEASKHYARVLELWRNADPELQTLVDTARQHLARLKRATGS